MLTNNSINEEKTTIFDKLFSSKKQPNFKNQYWAELLKAIFFVVMSSFVYKFLLNICGSLLVNVFNINASVFVNTVIGNIISYVCLILSYGILYYFTFHKTNNIVESDKLKNNDLLNIPKINPILMCVIAYGLAMFGSIMSLLSCTLSNYIATFFSEKTQNVINQSTVAGEYEVAGMNIGILIGFIIYTAILAPLCEEFIFRKVMYEHFEPYSEKATIILTSVLFAFFHGNIQQASFAIAVGVGLALLRRYTKTWYYGIFVHSLINITSLVFKFAKTYTNLNDSIFDWYIIICGCVALLLLGFNKKIVSDLTVKKSKMI